MALVNEHFAKLPRSYLFPEIERRVEAHLAAHPHDRSRLIRGGIGDVTEPLPPACIAALHAAVDDLATRERFRGYGPAAGHAFVREAIVSAEYAHTGIDPSEIFLSDGSKGDVGHALEIFAPGNRAAITDPVYPVYVDTNVMDGRTGGLGPDGFFEGLIPLRARPENGFIPEIPAQRADLYYLCFPNNPTGAMIDRPRLAAWVEHALATDAVILYDGAYADYLGDPSLPRTIYEIPGAERCAMEFRSFSKSAGFTGLRCGWTVCPRSLHARTAAGEAVPLHPIWTRRWSTRSNGVSWPVQCAAAAACSPQGRREVRALVELYRGNAARLRAAAAAAGLEVWGGEHAPYVWARCPEGLSSWEFFDRLLREDAVVVTPGSGFGPGGEGFIRISAFNTRERIEELSRRLAASPAAIAR